MIAPDHSGHNDSAASRDRCYRDGNPNFGVNTREVVWFSALDMGEKRQIRRLRHEPADLRGRKSEP